MTDFTLSGLGWSDHFARQCAPGETLLTPARISAVHRDRLDAIAETGPLSLVPTESAGSYAVGDWVLTSDGLALRRLDPHTDLARRAAGEGTATAQRIAANADTIAIVTSCNADFNEARLERYLALVAASGALPLVVLTKADLTQDPGEYRRRAERLSPLVTALTLDARQAEEAERLAPWCRDGATLALIGMSGTGKTTLRNALTGSQDLTQGIREDDARGRHTTTARHLVRTREGGWLIDTPGMRELQLAGAAEGIEALFEDIEALARQCRFSDCAHESEPGCAVLAAVADGTLDPARLARWKKLKREDRYNSETLAEARTRHRRFGKMVKGVVANDKRKRPRYPSQCTT